MNLYREIKNDISVIILIILIVMFVRNQFDFGLDDSDLEEELHEQLSDLDSNSLSYYDSWALSNMDLLEI